MKRFDPKNKYFGWGITAFGVIACSILFFMLLQHGKSISDAIGTLIGILSPIIWGMVITYLLWPLVKMFQRKLFEPLLQKIRPKKPVSKSLARGLSVVLAILGRAGFDCRARLAHHPAALYEHREHRAQLPAVLRHDLRLDQSLL